MTKPTTIISGPTPNGTVLQQIAAAAANESMAMLTPDAVRAIYGELHERLAAIHELLNAGTAANEEANRGLQAVQHRFAYMQEAMERSRKALAGCGLVIVGLAVLAAVGWTGWWLA
jgi:hypothetical protein